MSIWDSNDFGEQQIVNLVRFPDNIFRCLEKCDWPMKRLHFSNSESPESCMFRINQFHVVKQPKICLYPANITQLLISKPFEHEKLLFLTNLQAWRCHSRRRKHLNRPTIYPLSYVFLFLFLINALMCSILNHLTGLKIHQNGLQILFLDYSV